MFCISNCDGMIAPESVQAAFEQLRLSYPFYIVLVKLNGKFYVYRSKSFWDKEKKKTRAATTYLGRIKEDGSFVKKAERVGNVERTDAIPRAPEKLGFVAKV